MKYDGFYRGVDTSVRACARKGIVYQTISNWCTSKTNDSFSRKCVKLTPVAQMRDGMHWKGYSKYMNVQIEDIHCHM